jgi:hypothetical protein
VPRPALATLDDLEARLGTLNPDDTPRAVARLADASEIVRAYAGRTWLSSDEFDVEDIPGAIPGVVASMVERATLNPGGVVSEQAGPFGRSFGSDAAQRLFLTKAEKAVVRAAVGSTTVGTLSTTRGDLDTPAVTSNPSDPWPEETTVPW